MGLRAAFRRRFLDVLASIYIFNEHRGYTSLDRVLEPSHWMPYAARLQANGRGAKATWRERWTDYWIHKSLMLAELPAVFLNRKSQRLTSWPDETANAYS